MIFIGLGLEHLFADALIQQMMPDWFWMKRLLSVCAGLLLLPGGLAILLGYKIRLAAIVLGLFLVIVTALIHLPALFAMPESLSADWRWLWDVYQRSNFAKNICLLGGCIHLMNHRLGRYSLQSFQSNTF